VSHPASIATTVRLAQAGDARALETLVEAIAGDVYALALRMLWHPADAEDASQEILVRVITHLSQFGGRSAFRTWVFRIAANYLLTTRRRRMERHELSFETFAADLADGLADPGAAVDDPLLVEEVKIGCTQGMLLCLDRQQRIAFVLGDVFCLDSLEAAAVLGIAPATFRKRLERARSRLRAFVQAHCGLVNQAAACRCARRVPKAIELGRVDPGHLLFVERANPDPAVRVGDVVQEMEQLHATAALFRRDPALAAPAALTARVRRLVETTAPTLLRA
jgi:RNA polymerase sigma factor (sigma-70 family)